MMESFGRAAATALAAAAASESVWYKFLWVVVPGLVLAAILGIFRVFVWPLLYPWIMRLIRSARRSKAKRRLGPQTIDPGVRYYHFAQQRPEPGPGPFAEENRLVQDINKLNGLYPRPAREGTQLVFNDYGAPYELLLTPEHMRTTSIRLTGTDFFLPPSLTELVKERIARFDAYCRKRGIENTDSRLVRIVSPVRAGETLEAVRASYRLTAVTNLMLDVPLDKADVHLGKTIREYDSIQAHSDGYPPIDKSSLPSPLGVAIALFTGDGYLILLHRSANVSVYANKCGPSASGYADYGDIRGVGYTETLLELCTQIAKRETKEELCVDVDSDAVIPLGLYREYLRTMLQAFLVTHAQESLAEIIEMNRARGNAQCPEFQGVLAIHKTALPGVLNRMLRNEIQGCPEMGLEAAGLLVALANHAPELVGLERKVSPGS